MLDDVTTAATQYALRGLDSRAEVRAHNIANLNTPRRPGPDGGLRVDAARRAADRDPGGLTDPGRVPTPTLTGPQPNTVDMETELVGAMKDSLQRDALVNAYNTRTQTLRTVLRDTQ